MKQIASGKIHERIHVAGNLAYPGYVITGDSKCAMIEGGINLMGPLYLKSIRGILGDAKRLDYLFITHSHYDHLGSAFYLKQNIPGLAVGAHERVAPLLQKDSVIAMMNRLSEIQRAIFKDIAGDEDLRIRPMEFDLSLKEGDEFDLGGLTCRVYEVPGHTRDSLAFYIPQLKALFPGEAAGVPQGKEGIEPQVEFLSSFDDYLASLDKMIALAPAMICIGHGWVLSDDDASEFLVRSRAATFEYRKLIEQYISDAHGDIEKAIETMARKEYDEKGTIYQERNAYLTNLTAQVKHIAGLMRN
ncbi:MAG TPA: MBL fold metallo-hydrolase [Spirochaetota bacterium]|nr:MBL fold metallo-hydrolase [Spirochaetota bacterium]HPC41895.1 MBL fold metallo-hydrolase [Spirochaetota bacterium]HPL17175.1 MBL fold metallo-hydrolase [Spirochaetota bacterium]HQF09606.1 MBL fold metallo-hydrolase [Spirochaetota bacterium]HQH98324.1 MBL fold metallo-hydrolase [Spirochaetota bacterium]